MTSTHVDLVKSMYEAFARGDVAAVLEKFHPEIEWNEAEHFPYADGNPYIGPDAVVTGVFQRLMTEWDYWTLAIEEYLDAGEVVVAMGRYNSKHKASGTEISAQFAHVWWLRDGKAVRFQQYADTAQIAAAVQAS